MTIGYEISRNIKGWKNGFEMIISRTMVVVLAGCRTRVEGCWLCMSLQTESSWEPGGEDVETNGILERLCASMCGKRSQHCLSYPAEIIVGKGKGYSFFL